MLGERQLSNSIKTASAGELSIDMRRKKVMYNVEKDQVVRR